MKELVRFIHEVGALKLTPRAGWLKFGIKFPESVAEHSFRAAIIAFLLALSEDKDLEIASRAAVATLFHDLHETRTGDLDRLARRYVSIDEERAKKDQFGELDIEIDFSDVKNYVEDADKLELAFQAVEYSRSSKDALVLADKLDFKTELAKQIYKRLMDLKDMNWWI